MTRVFISLALAGLLAATATPAFALDACRLVTQRALPILPASGTAASEALARGQVRLTFVGHATFLIETPRGVSAETDYNDFVRSGRAPTVATMNRAHSTHFSRNPDPGIEHVLRGWDETGAGRAQHDIQVRDLSVRNVATNIRGWDGATLPDMNSIFMFESGGICIAHLGHLHHTLQREHLAELGRVDVLLVPVDGSFTLDIEGIIEVAKILQSTYVVPMHFFNPRTLDRFLNRARAYWPVEVNPTSSIVLSRATLPDEPRVLVIPGVHPRYDVRGWLTR